MYSMLRISPSLTLLTDILEKAGLINFNRRKHKWQNSLQTAYCWIQNSLISVFIVTHLLSTFSPSVRNGPQFYQRIYHDAASVSLALQNLLTQWRCKHLIRIKHLMEDSFSQADQELLIKVNRKQKLIIKILSLALFVILLQHVFHLLNPLSSNKEKDVRLKIPFVDDNKLGTYRSYILYFVYMNFLLILIGCINLNIMPFAITDVIAQYAILCNYIDKLGVPHYNSRQEEIFYTSIENNKYVVRLKRESKRPMASNVPDIGGSSQQPHKKHSCGRCHQAYEQSYLKQIIKFHQKLLSFQKEFMQFCTPNLFCQVLNNFVVNALCLLQLVQSPGSLSLLDWFKFVGELAAQMMLVFYQCSTSELLDDCNAKICRSVTDCQWLSCSVQTRHSLCLLLRRAQRPNHLRLCQGFVILRSAHFLRIIRASYTFVNFMQLTGKL